MINLRLDFSGLDEMVRFFGREEIRDQPAGRGTAIRQVPLREVIREASLRGLEKVVKFLVKRIRINAPFHSGALRNSVTGFLGPAIIAGGNRFTQKADPDAGTPERAASTELGATGRSFSRQGKKNVLDARIEVTAPYALFVHEFFKPAPGAEIQSQVQDPTPEGGVGGKFVERVVQTRQQDINRIMVESVQSALSGLKLVTKGSRGASIGPFLQRAVARRTGNAELDAAQAGSVISELVRREGTLQGAGFSGAFFGGEFGAETEL